MQTLADALPLPAGLERIRQRRVGGRGGRKQKDTGDPEKDIHSSTKLANASSGLRLMSGTSASAAG